ncbi:PAS domain S-box protein [Planktothrix agardhii]|jgi:diguanylate cyclase (GGDEF)-like protein/PAS domain S-box-containing protein|uniref:Putative Diguanylate cyclase n=1 Tax=Planktothrix agardhii TaxID=1160 RepID=A0A1J1JD76_PLAAG|nr:PAS domain S-box protein [Planktothrix agardhii]MCF3606790.1 PAS domain S-box protein [Planktothrix agardhii 1033]BBD56805.1 diguanylate cyclase with PAS/PAC and GAF sensors [Planktothrix agardhii NIES-204]MBG0747084.1 PAS domain S-box protein [Planktothrix agardhii KL2]MCB8751010.1 PAS domain S-box protein [Planktothrix agardhii 1810]MCB8759747.1 PAS domain S-box protein [Planktothrix agardhii 1813]
MVDLEQSEEELEQEVQDLRYQLEIAKETLRAIGNGEVDALVIAGLEGEQVYTLQGADSSYRMLVEEMKEGAATITTDSTLLLYCNKRLASLVKTPLKNLIGTDFKEFISPSDLTLFESLSQKANLGSGKAELTLIARDGTEVPVYLSINILNQKGVEVGCLIITDLSEQKRDEDIVAQERLTRLLLEQAAESIIVCDHQGKIIRASQEAQRILGANLLLSDFDDLIKLELLPQQNCGHSLRKKEKSSNSIFSIAPVINGHPYKGREVLFIRKDGEKINFLLSASPLSKPHSVFKGCVVILTNITERKWSEESLKKINEELEIKVSERTAELESLNSRLKQELVEQARTQQILQDQAQLLDLANDGIIAIDLNDHINYWNQGAEKLYGYSKSEALGNNLVKLLKIPSPQSLEKIKQEVLQKGNWEGELIQTNQQGNTVIIHSSWSLKKDSEGNPIAILKINRDITKAKQAEQAIIDSGLRLAGILDMAQDAIISINEQQQITLFNQGAEKIFGYRANEILKRPFSLLISEFSFQKDCQYHPELLPENRLIQDIGEYQEVTGYRKDGTEFPAEVSISRLSLEAGKILTVFMRDISDRKRVEIAIQKAQEDLEIKVQERTMQLATSNDELVREIAERKLLENQLHEVNEELEQRVEQRTNELAKAINDLKQEAIERQKTTLALQESEARFRAAIDGSLDAFFLLQSYRDAEGKLTNFVLVDMNSKAEELLSQNKDNLLGKELNDVFYQESNLGYFDHYLRAFRTRKGFEEELEVSNPNIKAKWLQIQVVPLDDGIALTCRDITERKKNEEAAQQANQNLTRWVNDLEQRNRETMLLGQMSEFLQACNSTEEAYQVMNDLLKPFFPKISGGLFVARNSKNLVEMVAIWGDLQGISDAVFSPQDCWALRRGRSHFVPATTSNLLCKHIHQKNYRQYQLNSNNSSEIIPKPPEKNKLPATYPVMVEHLCVPMIAQGDALGLLCLASEESGQISEDQQRLATAVAEHIALALANLKLREALEYQSIRDGLTGLYNRRYLEESLEREINRAQRQKFGLGIIMIDIDHFKNYNDTFGHNGGDIVLQQLGNILQKNVRGSDIACRYGGEEFTLILPEISLEFVKERAEQIRVEVQELKPKHRDQDLGQITLSLGISMFPNQGLTGESIMRAADTALYQAKEEGRNRVCVFGSNFDHYT